MPEPTTLKFMQFNIENLFLYLDHDKKYIPKNLSEKEWQTQTNSLVPLKPLEKLIALQETLKDIDADFIMLNEVGGLESLENFNSLFLNSHYEVFLKEGNSDRGIDVGYLIRKDLPFKYLLISHKNRPIDFIYPHEKLAGTTAKSHGFSRDVAELRVFAKDGYSPLFVILLTHLKSKLDPDSIDYEGRSRREAELKALIKLYNELKDELGDSTPILVAGDFNGEAQAQNCDPEFEALYTQSDLKDVFDIIQLEPEERVTQLRFPEWGTPKTWQLDYIFVSPHWQNKVVPEKSYVYRFKQDGKVELPKPSNAEELARLPSDHYPIVATIKNPIASS